ncbi:hypothetical protein CGMCC3_g10034 [Colletotrichum fructicola]|nr:uncharacterized protein CGMCC3_g10034 [Colletotrichum fructicola]KAE9574158.1 hypothetical protein CGMCC3_g10034 [Colletotrichum fructicola]KAF4482062.1 Vegetative incompatibility protein HET-E-1 [Colletotrichum fructicola Nara gc5]
MLLSATFSNGAKLWDLTDGMDLNVTPVSQEDQFIYTMAFSPDGTQLAVSSGSGLKIWDASTGQCLQELNEWKASDSGASVTFSSNGILLAKISEGNGNIAEIWNVSKTTCLQSLADERISTIAGLEFSPDNATLAILTKDIISLWDVGEGTCRVAYKSPDNFYALNEVRFSETGSHLLPYNWEDGNKAIRWESKTAAGPKEIEVAPLEEIHVAGYSTENHCSWVQKNGKNIIWIPPEYRTNTCVTWGPTMALGHESGRVAILRFTYFA